MILGYIIITSSGILLYEKFFIDHNLSSDDIVMFSGGIYAVQTFFQVISKKNIEEIIAEDWKVSIALSDKIIVGVFSTRDNNLAMGLAKKIRDIVSPIMGDEDRPEPQMIIFNKIRDILEKNDVDKEIKRINNSYQNMKYI
ncbi:MAG: hypothetical protein ACP6IU_13165 [Candidatus Asgardarchaeia archaeon]